MIQLSIGNGHSWISKMGEAMCGSRWISFLQSEVQYAVFEENRQSSSRAED